MDEVFMFVGECTLCLIGALSSCCVVYFIWNGAIELCWHYKYKHRFDKKPIAKCYCIDCKYHGAYDDNTLCLLSDRHFPNDWFCKDAKPKSAK